MPGESIPPWRIMHISRSRSPAPKRRPISLIRIRSRSLDHVPKARPISQVKRSAKQGILSPMMAFSKRRAKPSVSPVADETAIYIETAHEMRSEGKADGANEMRREETTDALRIEETADALRIEQKGEDVAAELTGDNTIRTTCMPCRFGVPFSCVNCGHLHFVVLCREPGMVWAIRCLHCRLIHKFSGFSFHSTHA